MPENTPGDAVHESTALRLQLDENLLGEHGAEWAEQLKHFLRKEPCWSDGQPATALAGQPANTILEVVTTVDVPASQGFVANEKFVAHTAGHVRPKITYLWENFSPWYLGKTEPVRAAHTLRCFDLRHPSVDIPMIMELGGERKCETLLSDMFYLMEKQGDGEEGALLTNCGCNIFYIRDVDDILRAAFVRWDAIGWYVHAFPIGHAYTWETGYRVFSRGSATE
jgi:hypothetical protein